MESGTIIDKESIYRSNFYMQIYCNQFKISYHFLQLQITFGITLQADLYALWY